MFQELFPSPDFDINGTELCIKVELIISLLAEVVIPLAPKDVYIRRTVQLTSRRCILNIYSTNILTEYFTHAAHSPFFSLFKMPFIS
jgi:hypothetical protein